LASLILGIYSLHYQSVAQNRLSKMPLIEKLGLDAFKLFGTYKMALFFIFHVFRWSLATLICMEILTYQNTPNMQTLL
jgi:hypothetical protein